MPDDALGSIGDNGLRKESARLQRENLRLVTLNRQLAASAAAQGLRAGAQASEAHGLRQQVSAMRASRFWQATLPLRLAVDLARGVGPQASPEALLVRRALQVARDEGPGAMVSRVRQHLARRRAARAAPGVRAPAEAPVDPASTGMQSPNHVLAPSVLIVAELTLPQCAKYRVWQKQEHFHRLGVPCRVVDWRHAEDCLTAASLATQAILYRVPAYEPVLHLIERLHRYRVPVAWEVDDLIFDSAMFLQNRNVDELDPELREGILSGVDLYREAMLACGAGIASTPCLADAMRTAGLSQVAVVENALDEETLRVAAALRDARSREFARPRDGVLITYGSGTKTHDADFREAAPALLRLLREWPDTRLRIVGELNLTPGFDLFGERVQKLPPTPYAHYLRLLADSDISIAPLEPTIFNDAKSNIKFLEAAILGVPSVCSPRSHFTDVIVDGENGMLAADETAWFATLSALAGDADLRRRIGQAALTTTLARYDPAAVAHAQVAPLLSQAPDLRRDAPLRVLAANVYYAPRSYGGATLVVEETTRRLHARGVDMHVVTGLPVDAPDRAVARSDQAGVTIFEIPVASGDAVAEFDDPSAGLAFGQVLDAVQPDVVHLHAVQWLSASLTAACAERGIPYVITVHDAWWVCARQFMVQANGKYCFQKTIDLHVCQNCLPGARHLEQRDTLLRAALEGAALLLSPSEAHRQLYLANGVPPERIEVLPNGVRLPPADRPRRKPGATLRFAYVGGNVEVKGFSIVKQAFEALTREDWQLVLVDNTLNLGFSSVDAADWHVRGSLDIVPAYPQDGIEAFFAGIDVLLFPSQWKESFGLTVREALVRDVWVIATDGGGPGEAIVDGVNGTLIPLDGRHDGLQHAVEALLDNPGRLANFTNPHAGDIIDYDAQTAALHETLARVAGRQPQAGGP